MQTQSQQGHLSGKHLPVPPDTLDLDLLTSASTPPCVKDPLRQTSKGTRLNFQAWAQPPLATLFPTAAAARYEALTQGILRPVSLSPRLQKGYWG